MGAEVTSGSGNGTVLLFGEENSQDQVIETSHRLACHAFGEARAIFSQSNIPAIMPGQSGEIFSVVFSPVDWVFASACENGDVLLWRVKFLR
jgi:WD40 repeat protein